MPESIMFRLYKRKILGVGHPSIDGWLAEHWNLPEWITVLIAYYHDPSQAPEDDGQLPMLAHVGGHAGAHNHIGWHADDVEPEFQEGVWEELGPKKEDIRSILNQLKEDMEDAEVFLEMSRQ